MPIEEAVSPASGQATPSPWEELIWLGEEIGRGWVSPKSSTEILSEMRR